VYVASLLEGFDRGTPTSMRDQRILVLIPVALPPLLVCCLSFYPLATANTTCCQVLAINGLLSRPLNHLSALSHHMLGSGTLISSLDLLVLLLTFLPL
jgi:hypothetical protein